MRSQRTRRRIGVTALIGLIAGITSIVSLASPAGAVAQTVIYDCEIPLAVDATTGAQTVAPIVVSYDGTAPAEARPDAASVTASGITASVVLDPVFVAGLLQGFIDAGFPAPNTIDFSATTSVSAQGPSTATSGPQGVLNSVSGPQAPNAAGNTFTFLLADETVNPVGAVDGDAIGFVGGPGADQAFTLLADTVPLPIDINGCVIADGVTLTASGVPGLDAPSGIISPPLAPFASTSLTNPAPVADAQNVQVIKNSAKNIQLTATDDVAVASYTIGTAPAVGSITSFDAATGAVEYTPGLDAEGADSFTFFATDDEGKAGAEATISLTVVGGDSKDQILNQEIIGDRLFLDQLEDGILTMNPVTLDGTTQQRSISMDNVLVRDARGDETTGWALDAKLLGDLINQRTGYDPVALPGGAIPMDQLEMSNVSCVVNDGAPVAAVNVTGGNTNFGAGAAVPMCDAAGPTSGGSFEADADLTLTIPPYVYTGNYQGTIQFTVQ